MASRKPLVITNGRIEQLQADQSVDIGLPLNGFKNRLVNGDMRFWQRGTSFNNANGIYATDHWREDHDGTTGTRTTSRVALPIADLSPLRGLRWFGRIDQTVAASGQTVHLFQQQIEDVRTLADTIVTVSFYASCVGTETLGVQFVQQFGTGGSPSGSVTVTSQSVELTSTVTRYSLTFSIPSISAKTIGTNEDSYLSFEFLLPVNETFQINITGVQVEQGPNATDFELRPDSIEFFLCRRRYQVYGKDLGIVAGSATQVVAFYKHNPAMRITPTAALSTTTPIVRGILNNTTATGTASALTLRSNDTVGGGVVINGFSGLAAGLVGYLDTGTVAFSADI